VLAVYGYGEVGALEEVGATFAEAGNVAPLTRTNEADVEGPPPAPPTPAPHGRPGPRKRDRGWTLVACLARSLRA
jgi:hypothetical protein